MIENHEPGIEAMGKFDALFKLIVPALFLIFWALGQVLNKETKPTPRPAPPSGPPIWPPPSPPGAGRPDEIVILESQTRPQAKPRRAGRRPGGAAAPARRETSRDREKKPGLPLLTTESLSPSESAQSQPAARPAATLAGLREALRSPEEVRRSLILAELVQPPLALRGRRRP